MVTSTTGLMLRRPARRRRSCIHSGVAPRLSSAADAARERSAARPRRRQHRAPGRADRRRPANRRCASAASVRPPVSAATSRATPSTDIESPRFGVDLEFEHRVVERQVLAQRSADGRISRQFEQARRGLAARPSSFAEHSMPADSTPRSFAALIVQSARQHRAHRGERRLQTERAHSPRRRRSAAARRAVSTLADAQLVGFRMRRDRRRSRPTTTPLNAGAAGSSAFDFEARKRQATRELLRRSQGMSTHSREPGQRQLHDHPPRNWRRKRRSFSKNSRRSFTP